MSVIDSYYVQLAANVDQLKKDLDSATVMVHSAAGEQQAAATGASDGMTQLGLSATVAGQNIDAGMRRSAGSITEARGAARLLEESFGITLPRELNTFLAKSADIGPMFTAAFDIAVPIAFLAALVPIGEKIYTMVEGAQQLTTAMKESMTATEKVATEMEAILAANAKIGKDAAAQAAIDLQTQDAKVAALKAELAGLQSVEAERQKVLNTALGDPLNPDRIKTTQAALDQATSDVDAKLAEIAVAQQKAVGILLQMDQDRQTSLDKLTKKQQEASDAANALALQEVEIRQSASDTIQAGIDSSLKQQKASFDKFWKDIGDGLDKTQKAQEATLIQCVDDIVEQAKEAYQTTVDINTELETQRKAQQASMMADVDQIVAQAQEQYKEWDEVAKQQDAAQNKIQSSVNRTFDSMERGIANSIVHWQGFGDSIKSVFDDLATSVITNLEKVLFGGIEKSLTSLISKFLGVAPLGGLGLGAAAASPAALAGISSSTLSGAAAELRASMVLAPLPGFLGLSTVAGSGILGMSAAASAAVIAGGAVALAIAGYLGVQWATGPSAWQAADKEIERDLGLSGLGNAFASWCASKGITEERAWPWRKELYTSPSFIAEVAVPYAQQGGHLGVLLGSLGNITTAWGTFNLQAEATIGVTTGSWSAYNRAWNSSIGRGAAFGTLGVALDEGGMQSINIAAPTIAAPAAIGAGGVNYSSSTFQNAVLSAIRNSYNSGGLDFLAP